MSVLDLLRPAPYAEEIQDQDVIKKKYRYWRFRTFYGMYIGYALYYFTRKSFAFTMPFLIDLGFDKMALGVLLSVLSIAYGFSKFISGIVGDKSNPRFFMGIGLILTGLFNVFFGFSNSLIFFSIFLALNGWFQGWGWPGCAKLLTHWYSQSERGLWWSLWNTSHNLGGFLIPYIVAYSALFWGWRASMVIPGILCILGGILLINRLRDTPQSLGLPSIEKFKNEYPANHKNTKEKVSLSVKEILLDYVLKNPFIWILGISYFFIYVVRMAVNDWSMLYLMESKKYTHGVAAFCVSWFEVGGLFGSLLAGWASDKIFRGKRNPVNVLYSVAILLMCYLMWAFKSHSPVIDSCLMFFSGFFIFGPQMLIGMAAAELSHKKAAATASGFAGCFGYLGAAASGFPLSSVTSNWGWDGYFVVLAACAVIAAFLLIPLWSIKTNPKDKLGFSKEMEEA